MRLFAFIFTLASLVLIFSCSKNDDESKDGNKKLLKGKADSTQTINSYILGRNIHYSVYLPYGYDTSTLKYPVLYLLHGMGGNHRDWILNGMEYVMNHNISNETIKEMIVIMPEGLDAFYCNNYNGGMMLYEDFFIQEFIPHIESKYRINTSRNGRAIAGLSMGGYGTTLHAFRRPEYFCAAYAMSAAFDIGNSAPNLKEIVNKAVATYPQMLPEFTMECGTEDFLYNTNQQFDEFLTAADVPHNYISRAGTHDWIFWKACLPKALLFVNSYLE